MHTITKLCKCVDRLYCFRRCRITCHIFRFCGQRANRLLSLERLGYGRTISYSRITRDTKSAITTRSIIRLRKGNYIQRNASTRKLTFNRHRTSSNSITKDPLACSVMTLRSMRHNRVRYKTGEAISGLVHVIRYIRDAIMRWSKFCYTTGSQSEA